MICAIAVGSATYLIPALLINTVILIYCLTPHADAAFKQIRQSAPAGAGLLLVEEVRTAPLAEESAAVSAVAAEAVTEEAVAEKAVAEVAIAEADTNIAETAVMDSGAPIAGTAAALLAVEALASQEKEEEAAPAEAAPAEAALTDAALLDASPTEAALIAGLSQIDGAETGDGTALPSEAFTELPPFITEVAPAPAARRKVEIETIEGIGPTYGTKLKAIGIRYVADLLEAGCSRKGREVLVEKTGIPSSLILKWVNMADLMRISGVGEEYSELLECAGVDTVKELRNRNPEHLYQAMLQANELRKLVRRTPHLTEVQSWVSQAKQLDPVMTY
jgi:hypothetical protein